MSDSNIGTGAAVDFGKDRYLAVAIHQVMGEYGWKGIEKHFGADYKIIYIKSDSPLEKIEVRAHKMGNRLDVEFLGSTPKKGLMDRVFDFNVREIPKKFSLNNYISDDMKLMNEQRLRNIVGVVVKELEDINK
ncbi:MAG: hypothetical protein K8R64_02650 [Methanosarcinaceae archaeon]|nr:hypothetical protein [Methanosarcinaceae archaeon]